MQTVPNNNRVATQPRYAPTRKCAAIFGLSRTRQYNLAGQGKIRIVRVDGRSLVDLESVERYLASCPPANIRAAA